MDTLTFSATGLPPGFTINPATGQVAGVAPAIDAVYPVTVSVTDGWTSVSQSFRWTIVVPDTTAPTLTLSAPANVSRPYTVRSEGVV